MARNMDAILEDLKIRSTEAVEAANELDSLGLEAMIGALEQPEVLVSPGGRRTLSKHLARQEMSAVLPSLVKAVSHGDWRPCQVACDALCLIGKEVVPALAERLLQKDIGTEGKKNIILALLRLGGADALKSIQKVAAEDNDADVRESAVSTLGRIGIEDEKPILLALQDESENVRYAAAIAAGWLRIKDAAKGILELMKELSGDRKAYAIYALDRIGDLQATPIVCESLKDTEPYVRWSAAVALRRLWREDCHDRLIEMLDDPEETVAAAASETLRMKMDGEARIR